MINNENKPCTYREHLHRALTPFKEEAYKYVDENGQTRIQDERETLSIVFSEFILSMNALTVWLSDQLLREDGVDIILGGNKISSPKTDNPTTLDFMRVYSGGDFLRHTQLFMKLQSFVEWLLPQDVMPLDEEDLWDSFEHLGRKWNEFAALQTKEDN